jgi:WD40 repeat protein
MRTAWFAMLLMTPLAVAQVPAWRVYDAWPFDGAEASRRQAETAKALEIAERLRVPLGKDVTLDFRLIPAGKFTMGSPKTEPGHENDEPLHDETVAEPFYMMESQVTLEAYKALLGEPPGPQAGDDPKLPARVAYRDAVDKLLPAIAKVTPKGWTPILPDRVRLEYAARAGVAGMNPGGDGEKAAEPYAWFRSNSGGKIHPVAQKKANAWGLFDVLGNQWHWYWADAGNDGDRSTANHLVYGGTYNQPASGNGARLANIMVSRGPEGVRFALLREETSLPKGHPTPKSTESTKIDVTCPAIAQECAPRAYQQIREDHRPPELVVLGTAAKEPEGEVTVERVIAGVWDTKKRLITNLGPGDGKPQIYSVAPTLYSDGPEFELRNRSDPSEEKVERVLAAARLDYHTLAAECIFVGIAKQAIGLDYRTVEVVRSIHGTELAVGQQVVVATGGTIRWGGRRASLRAEPTIYFIRAIRTEPAGRRFLPGEVPPGVLVYEPSWHQPAALEAEVRAALRRRVTYPIRQATVDSKPARIREVTFRGTTAEAIEMLGSTNDSAVTYGWRKLVLDPSSLPALAKAIESRLFLPKDEPDEFRLLANLIRVVGDMAQDEKNADAARLLVEMLDRTLDRYVKNPPPLPEAPKVEWFRDEGSRVDVLHPVHWLIEQMDDETVHRRLAPKLLAARDQARGKWRAEIQLAFDHRGIDDQRELEVALDRMRDVRPIRSTHYMHHPMMYAIAFSHDGQHLATAGFQSVRVWKVADWSKEADIVCEASAQVVRFSPDDRFLYAGSTGASGFVVRYDWRAGKIDQTYDTHKDSVCELELSRDGKRMAGSSYFEQRFTVAETGTGKTIASYAMNDLCHDLSLSADGKFLLRSIGERGYHKPRWTLESVDGTKIKQPDLLGSDWWRFSPAGKYVVSLRRDEPAAEDAPTPIRVGLHDPVDFRTLGATTITPFEHVFGTRMCISDDDRRVALVDMRRVVVLDLPSLKVVRTFDVPARKEPQSFALSPDGKIFAAVDEHSTPILYVVDSGRQILPTPAHTDGIESLLFRADGKALQTIDGDHRICTWDADTLVLKSRVEFDPAWTALGVREPDGRYVLCRESKEEDEFTVLRTVDAETGKAIATTTVPKLDEFDRVTVEWLNDREALVLMRKHVVRIDYRAGKMLADVPRAELDLEKDKAEPIDADAVVSVSAYQNRMWVEVVNPSTGNRQQIANVELPSYTGRGGVIPGSKNYYASGPNFYVVDRKTLKILVDRPIPRVDVLSTRFSPDGSRFALVIGGTNVLYRRPGQMNAPQRTLIRIHETRTGRTLGAFRPSTNWVAVRFSPDGGRIAVVNEDNTLEVWSLATLKSE